MGKKTMEDDFILFKRGTKILYVNFGLSQL